MSKELTPKRQGAGKKPAKWSVTAKHYAAYVEEHDTHPTKSTNNQAEKRLYVWAAEQKRKHKRGKLKAEKVCTLEKIVGWQWAKQTPWSTNAERYAAYVKEHNKLPARKAPGMDETMLILWAMIRSEE